MTSEVYIWQKIKNIIDYYLYYGDVYYDCQCKCVWWFERWLKDDQALKLAAGYLVANEVQRLTKISALELFLASTAVNYMDDKDLTNAVVKSLVYQIKF